MRRAFIASGLFLLVAGCALPPEQVPLKPLAEDGPPQTYSDLITRARVQAAAATEAFYVNKWADLEDAAKGIEQTSHFLGNATEVPVRHKDTLRIEAGDLGKEAGKLKDAAREKDDKRVTESLQRLNLKVRQLRPMD